METLVPVVLVALFVAAVAVVVLRSGRARSEAEKRAALALQRVETMERQMADWEKTKAETIEAAKAAALASTREMSSKLLEDHKRESESANKVAEERVKKTTEDLQKHFNDVVKSVASLKDQVSESRERVETVWRALSNPGGAGYFAEIGLENTLKSFGLEAGRDFAMQYTISGDAEGKRLRPDAVVFLPGDADNPRVSLSQFRDVDESTTSGRGRVHLGAGDSLGREIFVHYLASLEAEDKGERLATGESDVPSDR